MNPEQYAALQAVIVGKVLQWVDGLTQFFVPQALSPTAWLKFLELLFPQVQQSRYQSAALARKFYDLERGSAFPQLVRHDRNLEPYDFRQFVKEMEPARKRMSLPESPPDARTSMQLLVARTVENGGRRQIIKAVEDDTELTDELLARPKLGKVLSEGRPVKGWARIATGKETCSWCLMLVSRGPVYESAITAGLDLTDVDAEEAYALDSQELSTLMDEWHPGCDCKVIPVYDYNNWAGRYEAERSYELWADATKEARRVLRDEPGKMYFSRKKNAWLPTTLNREAQNALRRQLAAGVVSMKELTAAAA